MARSKINTALVLAAFGLPGGIAAAQAQAQAQAHAPALALAPTAQRLTIEGIVLFTPAGQALYRDIRENANAPKMTWVCDAKVDRTADDQQSGIGPRPEIGFKLLKSCLDKFPAYVAPAEAQPVGDFTIVNRSDGVRQWAYRGNPLYTSIKDKVSGQTNGVQAGFGGFRRGGMGFATVDSPLPVGFKLARRAEGLVLASADTERAVYTPRGRLQQAAVTGREDFKPIAAPAIARLSGDWSVVDRGLGTKQYAFRGKPLYTAATSLNDLEIGKAKDWEPVVLFKAPSPPAQVGTKMTLLGDVFTNSKGMTLYTYNCNSGGFAGRVTCDDAGDPAAFMVALCGSGEECAMRWKPYIAPANARPTGEFSVVDITYPMFTEHRGELYPGSAPKVKAWAYRGKPLFTYYEDEKPGDIWGDGTGGIWGSTFTALQVPGRSAIFFEP